MARIRIYKKSFLATLTSLLATGLFLCGVALLISQEWIGGVVFIVGGIGLMFCAENINDKKVFNLWIKDIENKGVVGNFPMSLDVAVKLYNANPGKRTLEYIRKHNPKAADAISASIQKKTFSH